MAIIVSEQVSIAELDEAMKYIQILLADDRLRPQRRNVLLETLNDLLDERLKLK